ncbi:MAG: HEAT repeat domain-containing protein [Blastocatellia bacterium]|nr:HEAT repeat domain-containing protein [Blastocatellia bacterium]MBK6424858.1 HEAT repeat domain-containing protein [Blastocatellia bacterium]
MSTCTLLLNSPKRRAGAGWLAGSVAALLLTVPVVAATSQDDTAAEAERKALAEAREHIGRSEWKAAVDRLRMNIEKFPKSPQIDASLYWYAFSLKKLGMRAESMAAVERILAEHNASRWAKDAQALAIEMGRSGFDDPAVRRSEDDDLKIIALQGLFDTNPQRALAISTDLVKNGSKASPALREGALMLIGQSDDPKAVDLLLDVVKNGENVGLRRSAVIGLSHRIDDKVDDAVDARVVAALRDLTLTSTDVEVSRMALFTLARDESPAGRTFIEQLATSGKSQDLRQHAILMLGNYDDDAAVDSLIRIYDANVDTEVARFAVIALSQSKRPKAAEKLMQIFKTAKDSDIRRMAMMQLAEGSPEKAVEALSSAYASETDISVKLGIIDTIAQIEDPRAMRKLIEIARAEKVHELRKRAVFWIAESDDPESGKYLEELLKAGD